MLVRLLNVVRNISSHRLIKIDKNVVKEREYQVVIIAIGNRKRQFYRFVALMTHRTPRNKLYRYI